MDLELLLSRVKAAGASLGALNGKLLVLDPAKRLPDELCDQLDDHHDALVQHFQRQARRQDAWWRRAIGDSVAASTLCGAGVEAGDGCASARLELPAQAVADLCALGGDGEAETMAGLAWAWLLSRYTGERRITYFAATSGRGLGLSAIAGMKGLVLNLHPVTLELGQPEQLCRLYEELALARRRDAEYGYPAYTDHNKFGGATHQPETVLVFERGGRKPGQPGGELHSLSALAALDPKGVLIVADDGAAMALEFQYATAHWSAPRAQALLAHLAAVLAQLARGAATGVAPGPIEMVRGAERERLLALGRGADGAAPEAACLHQLVERAAARHPERTAVLWRGVSLSYAELERRANRLAHRLLVRRSRPGAVVGICLPRTPELIVAMLAVLKAGCAYLPLDPAYPDARLDYMLEDAGAELVIADGAQARRLERGALAVLDPATVAEEGGDGALLAGGASPGSLAYVIYTSGSTGAPKGAMIAHRAATSLLQWARGRFQDAELHSVLCSTSVCFDLSIFEIFLPLATGNRAVLVDSLLELASGGVQPEITLINGVPSAVAELIGNSGIPASVRTVCLAGEPLRRKLVDRIHAHASVEAVYNLYGPSEYTTYATCSALARGGAGEPGIGRPLDGATAYVLDPDGGLLPAGAKGELYLGGRGIADGYIGRPDLSAERFVPNPVDGEGPPVLYRTGDLVRWNDAGELEFLGRADAQVKLRGFRVEPGEIEACLNDLDGVEGAAVAVREQQGEQCLVAYVVWRGVAPDGAREALKQALAARLPAHMVPQVLVFLPGLPLTLNGKLDRKRLPAPDGGDLQSGQYTAPRSDTERVLCAQFEKLLGVARVGVHDDFFSLGGHSLLVFRQLILVRNTLGVELPLKALFECPTVAQLAVRIAQVGGAPALPPLERCARGVPIPASPGQQRFWFLYSADPASAEYNLPLAFLLRGALDLNACQLALDAILVRHEALRTVLCEQDGQLFQRIMAAAPAALRRLDLSALESAEAARQARAAFAADQAQPFRLEQDIPVRFLLVRTGPDEHRLQINLHHAAVDGWSVNLILREFARLYDHHAHGDPLDLPELPIQYADFAQWQRRCLEGGAMAALRTHWRAALDGAPLLHALPLDHPRPAVQRGVGRALRSVVAPALLARFKAVCAARGATLFMGLQAVYAALLGGWSGRGDIVMGTPVAGRTAAAAEPLVGFFMNSVALRSRIARQASFTALLAQARGMILGALEAQQFPFDALVSELELRRDPSFQPVYQAWFVLQSQTEDYPAMRSLRLEGLERRDQDERRVHFDLSLNATELEDGLELLWEYQHDLFRPATIAWLGGAMEALLAQAAAAPEAPLLQAMPAPHPARDDGGRENMEDVRGYPLPLRQLERRIAALGGVGGAALACVDGPRLVALLATPSDLAARAAFLAGLDARLRPLLPLHQQPDALIAVDAPGPDAGCASLAGLLDPAHAVLAHRLAALDQLELAAGPGSGPGGEVDLVLDGGRAGLRMAASDTAPCGLAPGLFLACAYAMLMALELRRGALCVSAAILDPGQPLLLERGAAAPAAPAAVQPCRLSGEDTLRAVASQLAPGLEQPAARLAPALLAGQPGLERLQRAADCQFVYLPQDGVCGQVAPSGALSLTVACGDGQLELSWRSHGGQYTAERLLALSGRFQRLAGLLREQPDITLAALGRRLDTEARGRIMGLRKRFELNTI
ncbi:amino acid adenylation domain-containing protein [Oxalobacteraceae bacterium A2-2]